MTGLRDRKKEQVRNRIIVSARAQFVANGIEATTMEDVAADAEVSVATVYNYFGTKTALLLACVAEDTEAMVDDGRAVLARPGTNPAKAVQRLLGVYIERLTAWEPALLREVLSASFGRGGAELTTELAHMDQRLIDQMRTLLAGFQARGRLRAGVDPHEATLLLFATMVTQLFMFLALEGFDESALSQQVNRQVEIAFIGLAPQLQQKVK